MSASFWAIKAAKNKGNEVVPGTSKWVANELYCMNSEVLTHTEVFYHELSDDIGELNDFMRKALEGQDDKMFVETLTEAGENEYMNGDVIRKVDRNTEEELVECASASEVHDRREQADTMSNFTYISPENQGKGTLVDGDVDEKGPQSSPVIATTNSSTTYKTSRYTPKTPSPLKKDQGDDVRTSSQADLSFIPIANTIDPKNTVPTKLQSPYREQENAKMSSGDDSFQAISTAIRKSIAGKSANPRTSQFIHVHNTPNGIQENSQENALRAKNRATIGALSSRNLNDSGSTFVPLKQERGFTRKSMNKTPKRASFFVSLPSREPITISSSSNQSGNRVSDMKSRSLKVFEKLEIASRNEYGRAPTGHQSPTTLKKRTLPRETDNYSGFNSTYIKESLKRRSSARQLLIESKKTREESNGSVNPEEELTDNSNLRVQSEESQKQLKIDQGFGQSKQNSKPQFKLKSDNVPTTTKIPIPNNLHKKYSGFESIEKRPNQQIKNTSKLEEDEETKVDAKPRGNDNRKSPTKSPIINSIGSVLRRARNVFMNNPKSAESYEPVSSSTSTGSPNRDQSSSKSPTKLSLNRLTRERTRSPVRSSTISYTHRSRSPTKLLSIGASETNSRASSKLHNINLGLKNSTEPKSLHGKAEVDLINRLMIPTSASAAKTVKTPSRKIQEDRKTDNAQSSKNKFLTTTLNPTTHNPTKPQFNPTRMPTKSNQSPVKRSIPLNDEPELRETKTPSRLEFSNIPSLKKKSLMAERSEAAAQKPKQRIMIAMNHKLDTKLQTNPSTILKNETLNIERPNDVNSKQSSNILNDGSDIQQILKPQVKSNYGSLSTLPETSKNGETRETTNSEHRDYAKRFKNESKTPSRSHSRSKQKILEKKAARASNSDKKTSRRSANSKANDILTDPRTPAADRKIQSLDDTLPDIPTDDEDNKSHKVLQSWAETPQLHKTVMQNRTIDPVTIFGEVPRLNIEEIFESQASRYRGKSSPSNFTPDEKQRKREAREYAIKMGYKNSSHL